MRRHKDRGDKFVAMLNLDSIGCYSDELDTQKRPLPLAVFYPTRGDFIAFVGNLSSASLVRRVVQTFRDHARFPSEGAALPGVLPGVSSSDHASFWRAGVPAVLVTDTGAYRYHSYHAATDTPRMLDYQRMARVMEGLEAVVEDLAGATRAAR
jgi:Zn-dependent M28 family amino/carboxypeptidase